MQINILEYLENSAARFPDKAAFTDSEGEITFSQLNHASQAIGTAVYNITGGKTRTPVAVLTGRNAKAISGFMGAVASGNFYVPIDREMPVERMRLMLEKLKPSVILYTEKDLKIISRLSPSCPVLDIDSASRENADMDILSSIRRDIIDLDPLYIIFTSGSTGVPKGIVVPHRAVIDFTDWLAGITGCGSDDILANQAPFYFDLSVKDIYLTLKLGATAHIMQKQLFMFPTRLVDFLNERHVTSLFWATSAFNLVANSGIFLQKTPGFLKRVVLGGEALLSSVLNIWRSAMPGVTYINLYGPTETTVDCTYYIVDREFPDGEPVPIGKACLNMQVMLLDENLCPVKPGERGEICVRGTGLALGYFGDWEKTGSAFIQNPRNPFYRDIIYKTGDIGFELPDGNIVFASRADAQIKHMGYRIELGEIESRASGISGVSEAVCIYENEKIVMFYCGDAEKNDVALNMKALLPKYMVPGEIIRLHSFPRNANGKVHRSELRKNYVQDKQLT